MNTTYKVIIGVVIGLLVATGIGFLISRNAITSSSLGGVVGVGEVHTNTFWFVNGLFAGTNQQFAISSTGAITTSAPITIGSTGTAISTFKCYTTTWNPGAVSSSAPAYLTVSTPGASLGDVEQASLATSTQGLTLEANVLLNASTSQAILTAATSTGATTIATTTVKVCYMH